MSSVNLSRSLARFAAGAALLAAAVPALAETLVVRASGPSAGTFLPGKKLADNGSVTLKDGDVLTLLDGRGTRTLRGPGVFGTSASATAGGGTNIASFLGTRNTSRARTGAVRGTAPRSPNLWYVDVTKPTTMCVADATNVKLWRPAAAEAATLSIAGKGAKGSVSFAVGQALADWPLAELPLTEGVTYQLSGGDLAAPVTVKFTLLSPDANGIETTASTLIARKCDAQLNLLIETVALPEPATDSPS